MSKTLLVAQREFVENLRTKTFWLGILAFPVMIVLFWAGGKLLEESKDVRRYAVLDLTEDRWLSTEIERRRIKGMLEDPEAAAERIGETIAALPEGHPVKDLMARLGQFDGKVDEQALMSGDLSAMPPEAVREITRWTIDVMRDPLKQEQVQEIFTSMAPSDFELVDYTELGDDPEQALNDKVNDGELFAYFVVAGDPMLSDDQCRYVSNNTTDSDLRRWYARRATDVVRERRIAALNLSAEQARSIRDSFEFDELKVSETGETESVTTEEKASSFAPVAFVYLLWIAVFTAAQMLLTNTVEEKSNRLIEVLLSSVSPIQLMGGKVLGIAATGLTVVVSWVLSALIGVQFISGIGDIELVAIIGDPLYLTSFVAYFIAGYLLYAAVLVAFGSVCNSLKEAQNLLQPVFIVLIVPLIAMFFVVEDPNGTTARVLTYIPLFTPFLMMNRAGGPPPTWEYVASTIVILVSLWIAFVFAAKIFRVGILMTGKPPKIGEIIRWLRAPVGAVPAQKE